MSTLTGVGDTKILILLNGFEVFNTVITRCVEIARDLELKTKLCPKMRLSKQKMNR